MIFDCSAAHLDSRLVLFVFVLQDLTLKHGWRTGAIIPELRKEIKIMNTEQYIHMVAWSQALTGLIEQMQVRGETRKNVRVFFFCLRSEQFGSQPVGTFTPTGSP